MKTFGRSLVTPLQWIKDNNITELLILSNRDIGSKPALFGEDYYLNRLVSEFERSGVNIKIALLVDHKFSFKGQEYSKIGDIIEANSTVILHNVSPQHVLREKICKKIKIIMPVYFIWNKSSSVSSNLRSSFGLFLWQIFIDQYLVASWSFASYLKKMGFVRELIVIPPMYACPYCSEKDHHNKRNLLERSAPDLLTAVYIGSLSSRRFPLYKVIELLRKDVNKQYKLQIFTMSPTTAKRYISGNIEVTIIKKALSEKEKCEILSHAHIFIAPTKGTTMEPPLSVIEAKYHGAKIKNIK